MTTTTRNNLAHADASTIATVTAAVLGAALSVGATLLFDTSTAASVGIGTAAAIGNLLALRAIVRAIAQPPPAPMQATASSSSEGATTKESTTTNEAHAAQGKRGGAAWGLFALLKIGILFGGLWLLLARHIVTPLPLAIGYGVLPIAIAMSTLFSSRASAVD
jgi:hypothetical protein